MRKLNSSLFGIIPSTLHHKRSARKVIRSQHNSQRGNIAIMFGFMVSVLMLFSGGALDYTRFNAVRADLVEALDAAGLAMAQYDDVGGTEIDGLSGAQREAKLIEFGTAVFNENFKFKNTIQDLNLFFDLTPQRIRPRATGKVKTILLGIGGKLFNGKNTFDFLNVDTTVEITRRGSGRVELALVLDVTGSMDGSAGGKRKIDSLKDAVDNLLGVMFGETNTSEFVKIGVVPFNAYVNPGGSTGWSMAWADADAEAHYHGTRFIHVNGDGDSDGDGEAEIDNPSISGPEYANGIARVIDVDRKVNHFDLYDTMDSVDWMGCVEARPYPLDELDTPPGQGADGGLLSSANQPLTASQEPNARMRQAFQRAPEPVLSSAELSQVANSRWVPMFHPDEPDCTNEGSAECRDNWNWDVNNYDLAGVTRSLETRGYMFDNPDGDGFDDDAYDNHDFVEDYAYTHRNGDAEAFGHYSEVMVAFRYVSGTNFGSLNNYWDGVKERFTDLGAVDRGIDEYIIRSAYPGYWDEDAGIYRGKYDGVATITVDETITDSDDDMLGPSYDCPAPILPMTSDRQTIKTHVDGLYPNGNTNSANGAAWGWRLVSPEPPFTEGVPYDNGQWQKAVVIMTDGENVASGDNTHWGSRMTAYGFSREERMGEGVDRPGRGSSGFQADRMADQFDEKLLRICRRMREQDILVYTIVFGLNDATLEEVFRTCATSPKAPYYYKAPGADELEEAFGDIAADLVKLHISQ